MASSSETTSFQPAHREDREEEYHQAISTPNEGPETWSKPTRPGSPPKVPTRFLKSLSTREPSFSELASSPSRFSNSCSTTPLHLPFNKCRSISTSSYHHGHRCISSAFNKDRQILSIAVSRPLLYTGSQASNIRVWKLPDFSELALLKSNKAAGAVRALAVSDNRLFAAFSDCKIRVWRRSWDGFPTHVRVATIPTIADYLRNYVSGKDRKNMMKHLGSICSLAINGAGDLLYSASVDTSVKVWQTSKLKCIETIRAHPKAVNAILVAEDGAVVYTASDDATIKVWRCAGGGHYSLALTLPTHSSSPVKALALAADSTALYGGCTDGYLHCWLSAHLHYGGPLQGHRHAVLCLASVSSYVASGSADLTCRVWMRDGNGLHTCLAVLEGHVGPVRCVAAFPADDRHGCMLCTASLDGTIKVWRVTGSGDVSLGLGPTPGFQF